MTYNNELIKTKFCQSEKLFVLQIYERKLNFQIILEKSIFNNVSKNRGF